MPLKSMASSADLASILIRVRVWRDGVSISGRLGRRRVRSPAASGVRKSHRVELALSGSASRTLAGDLLGRQLVVAAQTGPGYRAFAARRGPRVGRGEHGAVQSAVALEPDLVLSSISRSPGGRRPSTYGLFKLQVLEFIACGASTSLSASRSAPDEPPVRRDLDLRPAFARSSATCDVEAGATICSSAPSGFKSSLAVR